MAAFRTCEARTVLVLARTALGVVCLKCLAWGVQKLIRSRYCLLLVLLPLAPGVFSESMPGKESVPSKEVQQRDARSNSEIRHAWKAAVDNYPLRATRLDLSVLSDKEQEDIQTKLSDPTRSYVAIGRDAYLTTANWAMVKQEDGFAIWQAQIRSVAALSLNVRFSDFDLEPGMSVKVYGLSSRGDTSVGEYTGRGLGDGGKFWSLTAPGDTVVVEYWLPAGREIRPVDFPFRVKRVSHRFRDEEGKLSGKSARRYNLESCDDYNQFCVDAEGFPEAQGVANYRITELGYTCSGALLNNKIEGDFTLYFLTAFHCIEDVVSSSGANGTFISAEFWFHYDNGELCSRTKRLTSRGGARFVAGSTLGDWALLRIEAWPVDDGGRTGYLYFQGWSSAPLEGRSRGLYGYGSYRGFRGHIFHHPGGRQMSFSEFDSEGLVDKRNGLFYSCSGSGCSHFEYSVDYPVRGGSSGAPLFYQLNKDERVVVGVHTNGQTIRSDGSAPMCGDFDYRNLWFGSRFSRMWGDERLRGALTYGKRYNIYNSSISATPDPPVIAEGSQDTVSVDYGARSVSFSLNARADDASSLSWQSVSGSGPRRGSVRFTDNTGSRADIVYEVSGGIRQEDQFSIQVRGAGGTDVIVITVVPTINPPVIAEGAEEEFRVDYGARSVSFSLNARADDVSSLSWQSVSGSGPRRGSVRFTDNTGSRAGIVYEVSGGIRQEDQFSIQVRGAGGTDVIVITVVPTINPPVIAEGAEEEFRVDYGVRSRSFSLNARADDASSLSWQLVSGSGPRRGSVRFTDRTGSRADIVYEVSGGIRQEDQFSIQVRGAGGTDVIVITVVSIITNPPVIAEGVEEEFRVDYGVRSRSFSLNARADDASSLSWRLVSGSVSRQGSVRFTDRTGPTAKVVYEVSGGIRQEDQFSIQVRGAGGTDVIVITVVPNIDPPVISEGREKEFQVDYGDRSLSFSLTAEADDASSLSWRLVSGSVSRQGSVRFTDNTGSRASIVYEVSGGIWQEDQFSVQVMGGGGTDVIVITVVPNIDPPVISEGREKEFQVDYGDRSLSFSLTAEADDASSLSWRLLADSGPGVRRSNVSFPTGQGAEARVVYEVSGGIKEPDRFSVQVSGRGGSDVVDVRVVIVPVIVEGNEVELSVASGSANGVLTLNVEAVGSNFLRWQLVPGSGPQQGDVRFTDSTGPTAGIVYEVSDGIRQKDQFVVRVGYGAQVGSGLGVGGSDEITILVMPDVPPVVTRVFGREVDGDDELTVYISPQTREVNLDVIAFDESPEKLKWTITGGAEASLNGSPMGGKEIVVSYRRSSEGVKSSSFLITVTDRFEQPDLFVVRMVEDGTTPVIVNEDVMTTESGKTLEVKIPYRSEQLILGLVTNSARAGLRGELVDSIPTPPTVSASFPQAAGEGGLKVDLQVPQSVDGALFRIRVSNGSANEEITIRVERELIIPVRSKVLLGGATR